MTCELGGRLEIVGGGAVYRLPGELLRPLELPGSRQAERRVERDEGDTRRRSAGLRLEERPRKGQGEQPQRCHAQRQEQQVAEILPLAVIDGCVAEQLHRGKPQPDLGVALEQVQHDRQGRRECTDEEQRRKERHHSFLARVERYASNAHSRG